MRRAFSSAEAEAEAWGFQSWWGGTLKENNRIKMETVKYKVM